MQGRHELTPCIIMLWTVQASTIPRALLVYLFSYRWRSEIVYVVLRVGYAKFVTPLIDSEQLPLTHNWCSSWTYSQIWQEKAVCAYKKVSWVSYIWSVFSGTGETSPSHKQKQWLDSETRIPTLYKRFWYLMISCPEPQMMHNRIPAIHDHPCKKPHHELSIIRV